MARSERFSPVLTGPIAARALGLDGFRDLEWPIAACKPDARTSEQGIIRARPWWPSSVVDGVEIAHPTLVLRHLGNQPVALERAAAIDRISPLDRVEFAVEHALRDGLADRAALRVRGSRSAGDRLLHQVLNQRGAEPPTGSYAETLGLQRLRYFGYSPWRQMAIISPSGKILHRVDFVLPFRRQPRPPFLLPWNGLIVEIDGREFHERTFERDHQRQTTYDSLGFHWVTFSANQVAHRPEDMRDAIEAALRRAQTRPRGRRTV